MEDGIRLLEDSMDENNRLIAELRAIECPQALAFIEQLEIWNRSYREALGC